MTTVSLILPTFNEPLIADSLRNLVNFLLGFPQYQFELIIADDSTDQTPSLIEKFLQSSPIAGKLVRGERKGKGDAIRLGSLAASGQVIFYMDADLTIPVENIPRFIQLIEEGYDVVIGERFTQRDLARFRETPLRFFLSLGLLFAQRYVIFQSHFFHDTQCGFKAFRREILQDMASKQTVQGGMYDIEYLYIAIKNRLRIAKERVLPLAEIRSSRIRVFRCMVDDPLDLLKVKVLGILGHYRLSVSTKKPIFHAKTAMPSNLVSQLIKDNPKQ
jgi:glycosyltransferase involved in cell wall biosynthesis